MKAMDTEQTTALSKAASRGQLAEWCSAERLDQRSLHPCLHQQRVWSNAREVRAARVTQPGKRVVAAAKHIDEHVSDLWKLMHMLMPIDMIRAASDSGLKSVELAFDLIAEATPFQQAQPSRSDETRVLPRRACQRILGQVQMQPQIHFLAIEFAQLRSAPSPRRTPGHAADGGYPTRARELERGRVDGFVLAEVVDDDGDLLSHARVDAGDSKRPPA